MVFAKKPQKNKINIIKIIHFRKNTFTLFHLTLITHLLVILQNFNNETNSFNHAFCSILL